MKIHIIGCSGTGKTYLAKGLSKKHNIPHFDLDDIYWDNNSQRYGVKRDIEKRNELLGDIFAKRDWIIEGVYYSWVQESFEQADMIYVLDIPKYIYKNRIIFRFIKRKLGIEKGKKETLKSLKELLKWTDTFRNNNLLEIETILKKYENKVIWISQSQMVNRIITKDTLQQ